MASFAYLRKPEPSAVTQKSRRVAARPFGNSLSRAAGSQREAGFATGVALRPQPRSDFGLGANCRATAGTSDGIQPKLAVSRATDSLEIEADRVANVVMRMSERASMSGTEPPLSVAPGSYVARKCNWLPHELVQRSSFEPFDPEEGVLEPGPAAEAESGPGGAQAGEEDIFTKPLAPQVPAARVASPGAELRALRGNGRALANDDKAFMESRFRYDFSNVRVHVGERPSRLAASFRARAFTHGTDVVFGAGEYRPGTDSGRRLLAHELTHVIQQNGLGAEQVHRMVWYPNKPTGKRSQPWGTGPIGDLRLGATDAGSPISIWRPDDGVTYWCHGYTFKGSTAKGGPYSLFGSDVPKVLVDDGWKRVDSCVAGRGDILVFYEDGGNVAHSGIIDSVSPSGARVDENKSTLTSKWGSGSLNTSSWLLNVKSYGGYRAYSKSPAYGPCSQRGANEMP